VERGGNGGGCFLCIDNKLITKHQKSSQKPKNEKTKKSIFINSHEFKKKKTKLPVPFLLLN
jgi:hypothetical protein